MVVGPLSAGRCEAIQYRGLGVFEIGKRQNALGLPLPADIAFGIGDGLLRRRRQFHES